MRPGRGGFSLILVVWVTALLAAMALHWSVRSRHQILALGNHVDRIVTRAAAEAGLAVSRATMERRLALADDPDDPLKDPWAMTGPLVIDGASTPGSEARWLARVTDLGRRLNLNTADAAQLRRFLSWSGLDARTAARVADATLDWHDSDILTRPDGAESDAYRDAGMGQRPSNRPFESVEEWGLVLGVTPEMYSAFSPYFTVKGSGRINVLRAPDALLVSLPGFSEEALAVVRRVTPTDFSALEGALSPATRAAIRANRPWLESRTTFLTDELEIEVVGHRDQGLVTTLRAVLARSGRESTLTDVVER